jgi:hypothetical protein
VAERVVFVGGASQWVLAPGLRVHSAAKLRKQGQEEAATLRKRLEEEKAAALQNQ